VQQIATLQEWLTWGPGEVEEIRKTLKGSTSIVDVGRGCLSVHVPEKGLNVGCVKGVDCNVRTLSRI